MRAQPLKFDMIGPPQTVRMVRASAQTLRFSPFLGWIEPFWAHSRFLRGRRGIITEQVRERLEARPHTVSGDRDPARRQILDILTSEVRLDTGVECPRLHPDDSLALLCFDSFDGLWPLDLEFTLRTRVGIGLTREEVRDLRTMCPWRPCTTNCATTRSRCGWARNTAN